MTIDRYLGSQLLIGTALALAALLAVSSLMDFVDQVNDIDATYTLAHVVHHIWLTAAGRVYELLPTAMLIGGLLNLGNLAAQSELIALRAAGYSRRRIIFSVLGVGSLLAAFIVLIGETWVPSAESAAAQLRGDERPGLFQETGVGIWSREGRRFIHARTAGEDGLYLDVSIYEFGDDHRLRRVLSGDSMRVESDRFVLQQVRDARVGEHSVQLEQSPQSVIARAAALGEGVLGSTPPDSMSTPELFRHIDFLKRSSLRYDLHEFVLWSRFSQPLSGLVMLLLALPFVFAPVRSSAGQRLFYGILIGLTYTLISKVSANAALVFEFAPAIGALAPPLLGFAAGLYRLAIYR